MDRSELLLAEDLVAGTSYDLGQYVLTHEDIVGFAQQWDPQSFHLDGAAAGSHYFGGVVASGAQLIAVFQRLTVLAVYRNWRVFAGKSLSDISFLRPVRADAVLQGHLTITGVTMTHPERALVAQSGWLTESGQRVMELTAQAYVYRRTSS